MTHNADLSFLAGLLAFMLVWGLIALSTVFRKLADGWSQAAHRRKGRWMP